MMTDSAESFQLMLRKINMNDLPRMERKPEIQRVQKEMLNLALEQAWGKPASEKLPSISYGPHGKPYFPSLPDFHYNFSDSGDYVLLAWSGAEIGVDLQEIVQTRYDIEKIARRFYTQEEYNILHSLQDNTHRRLVFFRLWAIKEAYLKYLGTGLSGGMNRYEIQPLQALAEETEPICGIIRATDKAINRAIDNSSQATYPPAVFKEIDLKELLRKEQLPPDSGYVAAVVSCKPDS